MKKYKIRVGVVRMTLMISVYLIGVLSTFAQQGNENESLTRNQLPSEYELIVAYYGRPGVSSLGVLGQYPLDSLIPIVKAKADEYAKASGNKNVVPAFDIIYGLAAADPGVHKDYILPLSSSKLMPYINAAKANYFLVFIDLQLGAKTLLEEIKPLLHYLKYENVHFVIDPEFEVNGLDVAPGKVVGHITGDDINQVQSAMTDYMKENGIEEGKILVVHMFRESMVQDKALVKNFDKIYLVMNLDGHCSPKLKINIYNNLYTDAVSAKIAGGFKLYFNEDKPALITPKHVLGLESVDGSRIKDTPSYINYQ